MQRAKVLTSGIFRRRAPLVFSKAGTRNPVFSPSKSKSGNPLFILLEGRWQFGSAQKNGEGYE